MFVHRRRWWRFSSSSFKPSPFSSGFLERRERALLKYRIAIEQPTLDALHVRDDALEQTRRQVLVLLAVGDGGGQLGRHDAAADALVGQHDDGAAAEVLHAQVGVAGRVGAVEELLGAGLEDVSDAGRVSRLHSC